jgi:hypothetical protein
MMDRLILCTPAVHSRLGEIFPSGSIKAALIGASLVGIRAQTILVVGAETLLPEDQEWIDANARHALKKGGEIRYLYETEKKDIPLMPDGRNAPGINSLWTHHSGRVYRVTGYKNVHGANDDRYPIMIDYQGVDTGNEWSRRLADWDRSFTPFQG